MNETTIVIDERQPPAKTASVHFSFAGYNEPESKHITSIDQSVISFSLETAVDLLDII